MLHLQNRTPQLLLTVFAVLAVLGLQQKPASAACENYESVGWVINKASGKRSKDVVGRSWHCANLRGAGDSFVSKEFSATSMICHSEEDCKSVSWVKNTRPNTTYVAINQQKASPGISKRTGETWMKSFVCLTNEKLENSYCWNHIKTTPFEERLNWEASMND